MKFRLGAIALALLLLIAATGCGSKKKAAVTTSSAPPATSTATTTTATSSGGATTPTTTSSSAGKPTSFASAKDCAQLEGIGKKFSSEFAASGGSTADYTKEVDLFKQLTAAAPSDIRPDLQTISDAFSSLASALAKAHLTPGKTPTASQLAALASASKSFSTAKVEAAVKNLEAWGESHCGVK